MKKLIARLADLAGLSHHGERYRYDSDPLLGPMQAANVPDRWVRTTCGYCSVGCGMLVGVTGRSPTGAGTRAVAVAGDPNHPVNLGKLCPKGLSEHRMLDVEGRLLTPMVNGHGASWDSALDTMLDRFQRLIETHGPESVAVISTGQLVTEEFYALGKLVRLGVGLKHYDGNTTLCMASAVSGYKMTLGSDGPPGAYEDLDHTDCLLLIGANIADNHPLLAPRVLNNRAATTIVVDPRVTKTSMFADLHLPLKPRSDITLLNGMIKLLIDEDLVDREYIEQHTDGFAELAERVRPYTLERVSRECGLEPADIERATRAFGTAKRAMAAWTMGINHSVQGSETSALITTLCLITGNIGRPGTGPFSITGQCNAMGTRETGFTASMPGYRAFDDPTARRELAELWQIDEDRLPTERGRAYPDIINGIIDGRIKGLWIIATNPVVSFPNRELLEEALDRLDTLVVQDGFQTPTTERAHVVLPAAIWGEKEGTFTNSERRVSRLRKAVEPPGEARADFDIFLDLADRMGQRDELFPGWKTAEDAFTEWRRVSAGRLCDYEGISYARIDAAGGVQWPCPEGSEALAGTPRLYTDGRFGRPNHRAKLHAVDPVPLSEPPSENYPFLLNTGRTVEHWHTRTKTGRIPVLEALSPEAWLEMHPADAERLKLHSGDRIRVTSPRGTVDKLQLRVTGVVREGELFMPFHWDERCANRLTLNEFDPISREPNYKQCAVRVERSIGR